MKRAPGAVGAVGLHVNGGCRRLESCPPVPAAQGHVDSVGSERARTAEHGPGSAGVEVVGRVVILSASGGLEGVSRPQGNSREQRVVLETSIPGRARLTRS